MGLILGITPPFPRSSSKHGKTHVVLKDTSIHEILNFLEACDSHGANVTTVITPTVNPDGHHPGEATYNVSHEARQLKRLYLKLRD